MKTSHTPAPVRGDSAEQWDDLWASGTPGSDPVARAMWDLGYRFWEKELGNPELLLEAGCGLARTAAFFASGGTRCVGVDLSFEGLRGALIENRVQGDVFHLPLRDATFDVVFSGGLLEHFTEPWIVLREMHRVLTPGGIIAATVIPKKHSAQSAVDGVASAAKGVGRVVIGRWRGLSSVRRDFPFFESKFGPKEYEQWLRELKLEPTIRPYGPLLGLPKGGERYARLLRRLIGVGLRINRSSGRLGFMWCPAFSIVARKPLD